MGTHENRLNMSTHSAVQMMDCNKNDNSKCKTVFFYFALNIDCGYSLEPPEYVLTFSLEHDFCSDIKNINLFLIINN